MEEKKEPCKICDSDTFTGFNIKMKLIPICEDCANSIFLQQARWYVDLQEKPEALKRWKVDRIESYWYYIGRYTKRYVEVTFWYNDQGERSESVREHSCTEGEDWDRPDWAKNITQFNESLTAK